MTADGPDWGRHARTALAEDDARRDVTTRLIARTDLRTAIGRLVAEEPLVVAGTPIIDAVLADFGADYRYRPGVAEGAWAGAGEVIGTIVTNARSLLGGERVILNFLQRLSAVATISRRAADATADSGAVVTDTRKTTPGLRDVEKYAVRVGGGVNHRSSLAAAVLFKDNHWELMGGNPDDLASVIAAAPADVPVQVEVESMAQLDAAVAAGVTKILVDNQSPETVGAWKRRVGPGVEIEASGGIGLDDVAAYAHAGADRISMGCLTHSAGSVSIRLEVALT